MFQRPVRKTALSFLLWVFITLGLVMNVRIPTHSVYGDDSWNSPYPVAQAISYQSGLVKTLQGFIVGLPVSSSSIVSGSLTNDY